jgi:hypothetical protein
MVDGVAVLARIIATGWLGAAARVTTTIIAKAKCPSIKCPHGG